MTARYVCPVCGRDMLSPTTLCSGGFLDTDHPANVQPIAAAVPVTETPESGESEASP